MAVHETSIEGLLVVRWPTQVDERGFFRQTMQLDELRGALRRNVTFRQANHARSAPGVLRGFHAEPWDKCVQVTRGTAFAAVADTRPDSPTFTRVETFHLGDVEDGRIRLFITSGLANAYCAYGDDDVDYLYDVTEPFREVDKQAVAYNDPVLNVDWPVADPILSAADRANPTLTERYGAAVVAARPDS